MKTLIGVVSVAVLALVGLLMYMGASNKEVRLRNQLTAQQKANEATFDTCWKTIQQLAQVADKHKDAFKEIFVGLNEARHYDKGGTLFKFVTESNPNFDSALFQKLANAIESHRKEFLNEQKKLIDLKREHDDVLTTVPSSWFVGSRAPIEIKVVTSSKTEKTFEAKKEDEIDVFKK